MSELQCAHARIEIFTQAKFFDDHFCRNTYTPINSAVLTKKDGERLEIKIFAAWGGASVPLGQTLNTNPNRYVAVRSLAWSGVTRIDVKIYMDAVLKVSTYYMVSGLHVLDLYVLNGNVHFDYNKIEVDITGVADGTAELDYIVTSTRNDMLPLESDLVGQIEIHDVPLSRGVPTASFTLENSGGTYNTKIADNDAIIIWLARGASSYALADKVFGGRIQKVGFNDQTYGSYHRTIHAESHAAELIQSVALFSAEYTAANGRTIIEAVLATALYCVRHPDDDKWFDAVGSSGSTDDRINSVHTVNYRERKLITPIREILGKASNPSNVTGFDIRVKPSGALIGHLRNSVDFRYGSTIYPEKLKADSDAHPVINEQTVYGAKRKEYPTVPDSLTDGIDNYAFSDNPEDSHNNTVYQLVGTAVYSAPQDYKMQLQLVGLEAKVSAGTGYYKITYQKEGGAETEIVTDQSFTNTAYQAKSHVTNIMGDRGKDITVRVYTRINSSDNTVYSRYHGGQGDIWKGDWGQEYGSVVTLDFAEKTVGSASIKVTGASQALIGASLQMENPVDCENCTLFHISLKRETVWDNWGSIILYDGAGKYAFRYHSISAGEWNVLEYATGPNASGWNCESGFDWRTVKKVVVSFASVASVSGNAWIDDLKFTQGSFTYTASNFSSQTSYGKRVAEPEIDLDLGSDVECQARAQSIIDAFSNPLGAVDPILTDGNAGLFASDAARIIVTNDLIDAWLEMREVTHTCVNGGQWNSSIILVADPIQHDYVMRLVFAEVERLRKLYWP